MKHNNHCQCCPACRDRLAKLEQMINLLFCYMGDYLPQEPVNPATLRLKKKPVPPPNPARIRPPEAAESQSEKKKTRYTL